jgi:hypothetical protein
LVGRAGASSPWVLLEGVGVGGLLNDGLGMDVFSWMLPLLVMSWLGDVRA